MQLTWNFVLNKDFDLPCLRVNNLTSFAAFFRRGAVSSHKPHWELNACLSFTIHSWKTSKQDSENVKIMFQCTSVNATAERSLCSFGVT